MHGFFSRNWPDTFPLTDPQDIFTAGYWSGVTFGVIVGLLIPIFHRKVMRRALGR